jgi:hypothetical protein
MYVLILTKMDWATFWLIFFYKDEDDYMYAVRK